MEPQRLDELLSAHFRQEVSEAGPRDEHLGYGALRRAGLGEPLRPEEESHLGSCAACTRGQAKFRAALRQRDQRRRMLR